MKAWRSDLGIPSLPFVFAQLAIHASEESIPNWDVIKEQQASVDLPNVAMIKTDDLELGDAGPPDRGELSGGGAKVCGRVLSRLLNK